jgi:hypothetical protein
MIKGAIQPLESYRLMEYAVPIPCYICEGENTFDAEYCRYCQAPMALAHQANAQKIQSQMVAVLGASAVGKTVYLGMLMDMLSRQPDRMQLLVRGAFSITLQQMTVAALSRGEFPGKTPNEPDRWNWVHCQVRYPKRRRPLELIVPDMAGDALLQEVDHPHTFRVIRNFLKKCSGALILVDGPKLQSGAREQDYFTMKLISYLGELDERGKPGWIKKPVALIFTKADQCPSCLADPAGYAQSQAAGLWQQCQERFRLYRCFAASVAGACAIRETHDGPALVPLRIEPHGILEPFQWMLENLRG